MVRDERIKERDMDPHIWSYFKMSARPHLITGSATVSQRTENTVFIIQY